MGDITGTTFAGCAVREVVGSDLVSTLYQADSSDNEQVLLRVVSEDLSVIEDVDRAAHRRFRTQAAAMLTVDDPHGPLLEEVGEFDGRGYVLSTFRESVSLPDFVAAAGADGIAAQRMLELLRPIAQLLDDAWDRGYPHGAINPSTLRFTVATDDVMAFLVGSGIGALLELRLKRDRRQLVVTDDLRYVAPEQLRRQPATGYTDQYALACAMAHLLTGRPPFERASIGGLFGAHLFVDPELDDRTSVAQDHHRQPDAAATPSHHVWAGIVARGMAKAPTERYASCGALCDAVEAALAAGVDRGSASTRSATVPVAAVAADDVAAAGGRFVARDAERDDAAVDRADRAAARSVPAAVDAAPGGPVADQRAGAVDHGDRHGDMGVEHGERPRVDTLRRSSNGAAPAWRPDEDAPLLSEVLSTRSRPARRSAGARVLIVLVTVLLLAAVGIAAWTALL